MQAGSSLKLHFEVFPEESPRYLMYGNNIAECRLSVCHTVRTLGHRNLIETKLRKNNHTHFVSLYL